MIGYAHSITIVFENNYLFTEKINHSVYYFYYISKILLNIFFPSLSALCYISLTDSWIHYFYIDLDTVFRRRDLSSGLFLSGFL